MAELNTRSKVVATVPLLVVSNLQSSIDYYCRVLGFQDPGAWGEPPCFAMMHRDEFDLMLSLAEKADQVRPNGPHGVWDFYMKVTDLAAEIAALNAAGGELVRQPTDMAYGMREIEVLDPDGYRICLAQDIGRQGSAR